MSPQPCVICSSDHREEIDRALLEDEPGRSVARRFVLTEASVRRHRQNHLELIGEDQDGAQDPRQLAERRLARERDEATERQLRRYEQEEIGRREQEAERQEAERRQQEARERAAELGRQLLAVAHELDDELMPPVVRALNEYLRLHAEYQRALSAIGERVSDDPPAWKIQSWTQARLGEHSPGGRKHDPYGGAPLAQRDRVVVRATRDVEGSR